MCPGRIKVTGYSAHTPRHPAPRAQRPPRPDPPDPPAQPDQIPLQAEPPPGQPPPAPRHQAPQQPRPELSIDNRHDLTYRWHRAPPSAADGPSGQAANLSRAGRSHSVVPTLTPGTPAPQAPPVMPALPDVSRTIRAHSAWRVTGVHSCSGRCAPSAFPRTATDGPRWRRVPRRGSRLSRVFRRDLRPGTRRIARRSSAPGCRRQQPGRTTWSAPAGIGNGRGTSCWQH